jgi:hypothetical protein
MMDSRDAGDRTVCSPVGRSGSDGRSERGALAIGRACPLQLAQRWPWRDAPTGGDAARSGSPPSRATVRPATGPRLSSANQCKRSDDAQPAGGHGGSARPPRGPDRARLQRGLVGPGRDGRAHQESSPHHHGSASPFAASLTAVARPAIVQFTTTVPPALRPKPRWEMSPSTSGRDG